MKTETFDGMWQDKMIFFFLHFIITFLIFKLPNFKLNCGSKFNLFVWQTTEQQLKLKKQNETKQIWLTTLPTIPMHFITLCWLSRALCRYGAVLWKFCLTVLSNNTRFCLGDTRVLPMFYSGNARYDAVIHAAYFYTSQPQYYTCY